MGQRGCTFESQLMGDEEQSGQMSFRGISILTWEWDGLYRRQRLQLKTALSGKFSPVRQRVQICMMRMGRYV